MPDEMTVTLQNKRITGKILTEYGSPGDWTGGLIAKCLDNIDLISEHCYCTNNQHFDLERGAYVNSDDPMVEWVRRPANRVRAKYEHYEEYLKRNADFKEKPVPINLDEWSFARGMQPNTYRPVPSYRVIPRNVPPFGCFPDGGLYLRNLLLKRQSQRSRA